MFGEKKIISKILVLLCFWGKHISLVISDINTDHVTYDTDYVTKLCLD
jgi:hypothetical protein